LATVVLAAGLLRDRVLLVEIANLELSLWEAVVGETASNTRELELLPQVVQDMSQAETVVAHVAKLGHRKPLTLLAVLAE
jgi:hypothetical protein